MSGLADVLQRLRTHEPRLREMGVSHAAVFGSIARGAATVNSDVDVMVDLDQSHRMGVFEYVRLTIFIGEILGTKSDVVIRDNLKPLVRENALRDAIDAF